MFQSCGLEVRDDLAKAQAICINVEDEKERNQCYRDAVSARREGDKLCRDQLAGRRDACKLLGEDRYDPDFDPAAFDNNFARLIKPNRYFPLTIGNRWEYRGGDEINVVTALNETKLIEGIRCIVFQDQVFDKKDLVEDTDDWYCQAKNGDVYYLGEEVKNFESFKGDKPRLPELVKIDGSFKHGRDGDKGGIFFFASPQRGEVYIEEFSLGNAEDVTEILSTTYAYGNGRDPELDRFVPAQLAARFCSGGDCVVTKNYSLLEPGIFARKYYAPGIGVFLEVNPAKGDVLQLVKCNFDPRCANLPPAR